MAKEYSKQDIKKAIEQLEKLRNHCLIMSIDAENAEWDKDIKALDLAIESLKPELQINKKIILTRNIKAKESFEVLHWWDEDTKKQCKKIVKKAVMDNLITKLLEKDLVKVNYENQNNLIIGEAEIEVLERNPNLTASAAAGGLNMAKLEKVAIGANWEKSFEKFGKKIDKVKTPGAGNMNCIIPETKNVLKELYKKYDLTPVEKEALDATFKALDIIEILKRNNLKFRKYKVHEEEKKDAELLYCDDKEVVLFQEVTKAAILNLNVNSARIINDNLLDFYL